MDYKQKYLKYKSKYFNLKNDLFIQEGGSKPILKIYYKRTNYNIMLVYGGKNREVAIDNGDHIEFEGDLFSDEECKNVVGKAFINYTVSSNCHQLNPDVKTIEILIVVNLLFDDGRKFVFYGRELTNKGKLKIKNKKLENYSLLAHLYNSKLKTQSDPEGLDYHIKNGKGTFQFTF